MPLGTASDLMVGEPVIAIGNAFGYEHTVSVGVVSALNRDVTLNRDVSYKALIQTDASINPGNSGGPLLNINGELVGLNVAIRAGAQGIGFAIPVDGMLRVAADLLARRRGGVWHGLTLRDQVEVSGGSLSRRVLVEKVMPGSPAAAVGLQPGDAIDRAAGQPVACRFDLERALLERNPGDRVQLAVRRAGEEKSAELVLQTSERSAAGGDLVWRKLGVRVGPVSPEAVTRVNPQLDGGLLILEVNPAGAAGQAGIQAGDILVGLHQWKTVTPDNVLFVMTHPDLGSFSPVRFFIIRGGQIRRGHLTPQD
jgi:serine protease Do